MPWKRQTFCILRHVVHQGKTYLVRGSVSCSINNNDMLDRSNNTFNFIPVANMYKLKILGMTTNQSLRILKQVAKRPDSLFRTTKKARSTVSRCLKVTNHAKNLVHKSLVLFGLEKIP